MRKIAGKVFLIVTENDPEFHIITVQLDPDHGDALQREYDFSSRGHYLGKERWIAISRTALRYDMDKIALGPVGFCEQDCSSEYSKCDQKLGRPGKAISVEHI